MADETTQAEEETSWWVFDVFADSDLPSTSFDEPLEWPETLDWGDVGGDDAELRFPEPFDSSATHLSDPIFPLAAEVEPFSAAPMPAPAPQEAASDQGEPTAAVAPLAALGGAPASRVAPATNHTVHERLPDSIWAADAKAAGAATGGLGGTTTVMADFDREGSGGWRRRFDFRHGNAPMIALISLVSLALLGMFLSVRARNDSPSDSSQTRTTSDRIAVQGTLNTVPLTVPNTTIAGPPATINIADLVPAAEDATTATAPAGSTGSGSGGSTATTAPRASGGTTATTQPAATQPTTATTAAPPAPVETTTPTTPAPPPVDSTTVTTRRTTSTSISLPTFPTTPGNTQPSIPFPTFPQGFGSNN